jgi:signal transduction histidine kinase
VQAQIINFFKRLTLAQRFMLASLAILVSGMIGIGAWVGQQIEEGVIQQTAATTALYLDSFVAPNLQELGEVDKLTPEHVTVLSHLLEDTPLGQKIVAFKVWDGQGRLLYSPNSTMVGQVFPIHEGLERAWQGEVVAEISDLQNAENILERASQSRLMEIYSPVRLRGTNQVIAVAEFYQTVDDLQEEIQVAQQRSWLVVGGATLVMYLLLAGFVQQASDTIVRQKSELNSQVIRLTDLLAQNEALHERVRRAAARTTALNERFLRRISAELHDGPAQDLGLALLRLDHVTARYTAHHPAGLNSSTEEDLNVIQSSLERAMQEVRGIAAGLSLPQLTRLTLAEVLAKVVRVHEQRTKTKVTLYFDDLPEQAPLPIKITLYRLIQEALNNAYRHAGGLGQQVKVVGQTDQLEVEVSDQGPGFNGVSAADWDKCLGLVGMRERVESLGGLFQIQSKPGLGTKVIVSLSLQGMETDDER